MIKHKPYVLESAGKKYLRFEEEEIITRNSIYWAVERMIKGDAVHMTGAIENRPGSLWNFVMNNLGEIIARYADGRMVYTPPMQAHKFIGAFKEFDARWDVCHTYPAKDTLREQCDETINAKVHH